MLTPLEHDTLLPIHWGMAHSVVAEYACIDCGRELLLAEGVVVSPLAQSELTLAQRVLPRMRTDHECACGGTSVRRRYAACLWPDEPDLPGLVWREEPGGVGGWWLRERDETEFALPDDLTERELVERWGRVASVRGLWCELLAATESIPLAHSEAGPGLALVCADPTHTDVTERLAELTPDGWVAVDALAYTGPGQASEWAGPWREDLEAGRRRLVALIDAQRAQVLLREHLGERGFSVATKDDYSVISRGERHEMMEHVRYLVICAGLGLTLAETAALIAFERTREADLMERLVEQLAAAGHTVDPTSTEGLHRALYRLGGRIDSEDAHRLVAALAADAGCPCGAGIAYRHLRPPNFAQTVRDPLAPVLSVRDARGAPYGLLLVRECAHMICYVAATDPDAGMSIAWEDGQFELVVTPLIDLDGTQMGVMCEGYNAATLLAAAPLRAALGDALGWKGPWRAVSATVDAFALAADRPTAECCQQRMRELLIRSRRDEATEAELDFHAVAPPAGTTPGGDIRVRMMPPMGIE